MRFTGKLGDASFLQQQPKENERLASPYHMLYRLAHVADHAFDNNVDFPS